MARQSSDFQVSRRDFLVGATTMVATSPLNAASRDGLHLRIADHARSLANGRHETVSLLVPSGSVETLLPAIQSFDALTGIRIVTHEAHYREVGTTLLVEMLRGNSPFDLALPPTYEIPDLVAAGAIQPLETFESAHGLPALVHDPIYTEGDSFDGRTFGYQTDGDVYLLFLNQHLLDDDELAARFEDGHGRAFDIPTTWEQLDTQTRFIHTTLDRPGAVLHRGRGQVEWEFWLRLHAKGVWPLSPDFEPRFASDAGVEALEEMISLTPFIAPRRNGRNSLRENWETFAREGAFASFGWGGTQKLFQRGTFDRQIELAYAPVPGGEGKSRPDRLPYFNWGWSYTVPTGARRPELSHAFALFAASPYLSNAAVSSEKGYFDPFRAQHFGDPTIREVYGSAFLDVQRMSLRNAMPDFYVANRTAYFDALGEWLTLALDGVATPKRALENVERHWRILSDGVLQQQALRWRRLRAKYPTAIAKRLSDT